MEKKHTKKRKITFPKAIGIITLCLGATALIVATLYGSQILAFIGLGLTFWGIILTYIQTEEYVKKNLLDATALPPLVTLNQLMEELDYNSKAIYLPPRYLTDPESNKAYIPKNMEEKLPTPEQIQAKEKQLFHENFKAMLLTPPGSELAKLFEKILETSFTRTDLLYLQFKIPKLFVEDLEIAQNMEISVEDSKIHVKIEKLAYIDLTIETSNLPRLYTSLGCPISSAIACALAKAIGKPIIIENQQINKDKAMEIIYRIMEGT